MKTHGEEGRWSSNIPVGRRGVRAMTMNIPISSSLLGWRGFRWLALVALSTMQKGENRRRSTRCSVVFPANCLIAFNGCSMWKVTCDWLLACTKRWCAMAVVRRQRFEITTRTRRKYYMCIMYVFIIICMYVYIWDLQVSVKLSSKFCHLRIFAVSWELKNQRYILFHQRSWSHSDHCCLNYKEYITKTSRRVINNFLHLQKSYENYTFCFHVDLVDA